jgi:hypothetical protein
MLTFFPISNILLRKQDDLVVAIYKLAPAVPAQ